MILRYGTIDIRLEEIIVGAANLPPKCSVLYCKPKQKLISIQESSEFRLLTSLSRSWFDQ